MKKILSVLLLALLFATLAGPIPAHAAGAVLHVKPTAIGDANCSSWANACTLQTALALAEATDEIWVQADVYLPGSNRTDTFTLENGVALYGGFAGTESSRDDRDWVANETILSGDIDGSNSYHVVTSSGLNSTAILDGFIITAGQADGGSGNNVGAGMYNTGGSPTIKNVIFQGNTTSTQGGGMYNDSGSPTLTNVFFMENSAGWGAGLYNNNGSSPTIINAIFFKNVAATGGGGMYNNANSSATIFNATFYGNQVTGNHGLDGGGILLEDSTITVTNAILWGNIIHPDADQSKSQIAYLDITSTSDVAYSIVQDGWSGTGNLDADPLFVDAAGGNLRLYISSPAINSGTDVCLAYDIEGKPRDGACDMGAYEFVISGAFGKISPTNAAAGQSLSPTLTWGASDNATYYEYCYSSVPGSCSKWNSAGSNTSVTLSDLAANYTYYWQVRAGGITEANGDTWWSFTTINASACTWPAYTPPTSPTFSDVPMNVGHWSWVERLANSTVTAGCGAGNYCPFSEVVRAQMAIFLLRGRHCGSSYTPPAIGASTGFGDVPLDATYAPWVKQLAIEGITAGCGGGNFCPLQVVNRAQMAIFLLRAKHGAAYSPPAVGATTGFGDVPLDATYAPWVKQLAAEGITAGCGGGNFCPLQNVNRAQMATFLVRAFGLP